MNNTNVSHTFFINSFEKLDFCGTEIYSFKGGKYTLPYDIVKLEYKGHKHQDCKGCTLNYTKILNDLSIYHSKFPNCCDVHKKLSNQKWFIEKDFENVPLFYAEKLFCSWDHILNFIDTDEWEEEILDYVDHVIDSFGSFPEGFGEALYLGRFITQLKNLLTENRIKGYSDRKNHILRHLNKYVNPNLNTKNKDTDFNVLIGIYNQWYKTFPFELSYFTHLKKKYASFTPLIESVRFNKYTEMYIATPRNKKVLINYLLEITNNILVEINTETLFKQGLINNISKIELELICQRREQKLKKGYINHSKNEDVKYRKILKEWLKDEIEFIKDLKPIIDKNPFIAYGNTVPLINDLMAASYKLQENKIFWNVDEDTRTKQILDLLPIQYHSKDQSKYGESGTGIKQGNVDGVIVDAVGTEYFIEAFNLEYIDTNNITSHINKLEQNYDSKGLYNKYVVIYCNLLENKFEDFTKSYLNFVNENMIFIYTKIGESTSIETKYTNSRIFKTCHLREGKEVSLYHILLKFPKKQIICKT